jgi:hypothetical protein
MTGPDTSIIDAPSRCERCDHVEAPSRAAVPSPHLAIIVAFDRVGLATLFRTWKVRLLFRRTASRVIIAEHETAEESSFCSR